MYCLENWSSQAYEDIEVIRLFIFLIGGVCAGCPALIWALSVLYHHYKNGSRTSVFAIFLLLSDLLELILNPLLVTYIFNTDFHPCKTIFALFTSARVYGQLLHQMVALENICQRYPLINNVFTPTCSIIFCIIFLLASFCHFGYFKLLIIFLCILPLIVCAVTYILTWKVPHDINKATDRKPGVMVLTVAMFTLIIVYVPFFVSFLTEMFMLDCLTSLRLISDPLLCVLVCRELSFYAHTDLTDRPHALY